MQPAGCSCSCTAPGDLPCFNPAFSWKKLKSLPFECSQRNISGQSSTFLRSHTALWHQVLSWGMMMSSTACCFSPVTREEFERLQGLHQSTEISSKAKKMCSSSSGLVHCPDRDSEMIFKSSKGHSSSRVTFLPALKSCRHKGVFCPCLCSASPACLGFVSRLGRFGSRAPSFLPGLAPSLSPAPLPPLAFF